MNYHVILRPEPEGGYTVFVPALPGCITWGESVDHARAMASEAITAYLQSLNKHNEPIPHDTGTLSTVVEVALPAEAARG